MTWPHVGAAAYVYVVQDGELVKVGSSIDPHVRWKRQIRRGVLVHVSPPYAMGRKVERAAHRLLKRDGLCVENEWFSASPSVAIAAIERAARIVDGGEETVPGVPANGLGVISGYVDHAICEQFKEWLRHQGPNMTAGMAIEIAICNLMANASRLSQTRCGSETDSLPCAPPMGSAQIEEQIGAWNGQGSTEKGDVRPHRRSDRR